MLTSVKQQTSNSVEQHPGYPKFESSRLCCLSTLGMGAIHSESSVAAQREGSKSADAVSIINTTCHASEYFQSNISYIRALNPGKHSTI